MGNGDPQYKAEAWKSVSLKKYEAQKNFLTSVQKVFTSKRNYGENFRAKESKYDANLGAFIRSKTTIKFASTWKYDANLLRIRSCKPTVRKK